MRVTTAILIQLQSEEGSVYLRISLHKSVKLTESKRNGSNGSWFTQ
jgi:hypothetical protein